MSQSDEIDAMLSNLNEIKSGGDPRSTQNVSKNKPLDALDVVTNEVDRLFDEHDMLADNMMRKNLSCGVARWGRRNGYCKYNTRLTKKRFNKRVTQTEYKKGTHAIVINEKILEDGNREGFIDTVRHEVAHALAYELHGSSQGHNSNWRMVANHLGADDSSCHNKRDRSDEYKYYIGCPNCDSEWGKTKRCKTIKQPFNRRCQCGQSPLCSYDADKEMPEAGVVAVDSLPWSNRDEWNEAGRP